MITLSIEAVLGVLFAVVVMQFFKRHPAAPASTGPVEDLANLKASDARVGDVISVSGAGDNWKISISRSTVPLPFRRATATGWS